MVLKGSAYVNFANNDYRLGYTWSATQSIPNNYSRVTVTLYIESLNSWANISDASASETKISINGDVKTFNAYSTLSSYQKKTLGSHTVNVPHNADGKKTFTIAGSHRWDINWAGTGHQTPLARSTDDLNVIPRTSSMSLNKTTANYGDSVTISIKREAAFKHRIRATFDKITVTLANNIDTSYNWTVPVAWMSRIPNSLSSWGYIYVDTMSGNTVIGTVYKRLDTKVPNNIVPSYSSLSIAEANAKVPAVVGVGNYVQGLSSLKALFNGASGTYSSTIKKYSLTVGSKIYQSAGSTISVSQVDYSGNVKITGMVTDSRGRTASKSMTLSFAPYSPPRISASAKRTEGGGGLAAVITRKGNISVLDGKNDYKSAVKWKVKGAPGYNTEQFIGTGKNPSFSYTNTTPNEMPSDKSYIIQVSVTDKFNTIYQDINLSVATAAMSIGVDGIGAGKVHEKGALDVLGATFFDGPIELKQNQYYNSNHEILNAKNSDISGLNGLYFNDTAEASGGEGLNWVKTGYDASGKFPGLNAFDSHRVKDGIGYLNNQVIYNDSDILWEGGMYMNSRHTITPSRRIDLCPNGWMLIWSYFGTAGVENHNYFTTYLPKKLAIVSGGSNHSLVSQSGNLGAKYLYCTNTSITGHDYNSGAGSKVGNYVLRWVYSY